MKNKRLILLFIFIIISIFVWAPKLKRSSLRKETKRPSVERGTEDLAGKTKLPLASKPEKPLRELRSLYSSWARDPFTLLPEEFFSKTQLTGIIWDEENPYAIINGNVVRVGDVVSGSEVVGIERESVTLRKEDGVYMLGIRKD